MAERAIFVGGTALAFLGLLLGMVRPNQSAVGLSLAFGHALLAPLVLLARWQKGLDGRAIAVLAYAHAFGSIGLWTTGPLMGVGAGMTAATVGASRFFGVRGALVSVGVNLLVIAGAAGAYSTGLLAAPATNDAHWDALDDWARIGATAATLALLVGLTIAPISERLELSFERAVRSLAELRRQRSTRQRGREALVGAARDEALGRLAGGVAHDVNNALAVMLTNAELLCEVLPEGSERRLLADEMVAATRRAAETTRGLLMLGRSQLEPTRVECAADVCERLVELLRLTCPETVTLSLERSGSRLPRMSSSTLEQLVLTQALDSLDAVLPTGTLTIRVRDFDGEGREPGVRVDIVAERRATSNDDPSASVSAVRRNLPPRAAHAVSDRTLEEAGGRMEVVDTPYGSVVMLDLPEGAAPSPIQSVTPTSRRAQRVLLVEDEDAVRRTMTRILERFGHGVVVAHDGASATQVFEDGRRIDLLVTDAVMPGTNTAEMLRAFRHRHPNTPILVCSGFVREELVRRGVADGDYGFLKKPFTPDELIGATATALAASSSRRSDS
jgi:CheY-like chemotaxis protein